MNSLIKFTLKCSQQVIVRTPSKGFGRGNKTAGWSLYLCVRCEMQPGF